MYYSIYRKPILVDGDHDVPGRRAVNRNGVGGGSVN